MAYAQGALVVESVPYGGGQSPPYLIVSNDTHPFHGVESIASLVTTTKRDATVPLA